MDLPSILEEQILHRLPPPRPAAVLVACSGGADSSALLAGLVELAEGAGRGKLGVCAAHLDHGLDPGSAGRALHTERLCRSLGVPLAAARRPVRELAKPGESIEAAARRLRYAFLEEARAAAGCDWIATGHHLDDQAETVLLRMLFGSGLEGLGGVAPERGRLLRPLLGVRRSELRAFLEARGLEAAEDPTNHDPTQPRSRVRHHLLPHLAAEVPELPERLARLAGAARGASRALGRRLEKHLRPHPVYGGLAVERRRLTALPAPLRPAALNLLHRRAGAPYPPTAAARRELLRQIEAGGRLGCDCGGPLRWEGRGGSLVLVRPRAPNAFFTYTLEVPGGLEIPDLSLRLTLRRAAGAWGGRQSAGCLDPVAGLTAARAALALPLAPGDAVTVRNRRPGDRIRPLGRRKQRRLKEVLIDRQVPRMLRDRLPLLCLGERIAWVPGVAIDERFRLAEPSTVWIAEITPRH